MIEIKSGIYCFENSINNKKYIGQSQNLENRIDGHLNLLKYDCDDSSALQNAYNKYGLESFKIWIIELCKVELLNERESYWIKELHSHRSEWGYNISWGGEKGLRGFKHSNESKKKMSEWQTGENGYWFGKHLPLKTRKKIGDAQLREKNHLFGKKQSDEVRKKISESRKGVKFSEEHKNNLAIANKNRGANLSDEERLIKSDKRRGRKIIKNASSIYVGVSYNKTNHNWVACISTSIRERLFLGTFPTELEAALAYNEAAIEFYGWKAKLNDISKEEIEKLWEMQIET